MDENDRLHRRGRWLGTAALAWSRTWRVARPDDAVLQKATAQGPVLFAFWHGQQLPLLPLHAGQGIVGLASRSRDGSLLAGALDALGYGSVRGSTSRGGAMGLRACIRAVETGQSVGLAVDGPRGPRHQVAPGIGSLAVHTRRPVVCMVGQCWPVLRLPSWDRFELPLPFARVTVRTAVVQGGDSAEDVQQAVQAALASLG